MNHAKKKKKKDMNQRRNEVDSRFFRGKKTLLPKTSIILFVCFHSFQQKVHPYSSSYCFSLLFDQYHHLFQKWSIKEACGFASPVPFCFIPVRAPLIPIENQSAELSADVELAQSTAYG